MRGVLALANHVKAADDAGKPYLSGLRNIADLNTGSEDCACQGLARRGTPCRIDQYRWHCMSRQAFGDQRGRDGQALGSFRARKPQTSTAQVIMLSNPGNAALTITGISLAGTNPGDFAQTNTCGSSLAAAASCTISVTFTPASAASFSATVSVADNAAGSPQTAALSGTGVAPPPAPDFSVSSSTPAETVQPGAAAQYTIAVASMSSESPFTSAVMLTASGLPPGATASFNPASVTPGASGANSTLTVQTAGMVASGVPNTSSSPGTDTTREYMTTASLAFLFVGFIRRRRRWHRSRDRAAPAKGRSSDCLSAQPG